MHRGKRVSSTRIFSVHVTHMPGRTDQSMSNGDSIGTGSGWRFADLLVDPHAATCSLYATRSNQLPR